MNLLFTTRSIRSLNYPTDSLLSRRYTHFTHNGNAGGLLIAFFLFTSRFIGFSWAVAMIEDSVKNQPPLHRYIHVYIHIVFILDEFRPERSRATLIKRQLIDSREMRGPSMIKNHKWLVGSRLTGGLIFYRECSRATIDYASAPLEKSPVGMQPARTERENASQTRSKPNEINEASLLLSFIRCIYVVYAEEIIDIFVNFSSLRR